MLQNEILQNKKKSIKKTAPGKRQPGPFSLCIGVWRSLMKYRLFSKHSLVICLEFFNSLVS